MAQLDEPQGTSLGDETKVKRVRSNSLYFTHGDVVLSAKWDQYIDSAAADMGVPDADEIWVYFRVEMIQLGYHSKVFADMFSLPTPGSDAMERYDGVPLVRLPDEGHAVEWLLMFIFTPHDLQHRRMHAKNALHTQWLLNIAAKYRVEGVRPFMLKQLQAEWPRNLFQWILQCNEHRAAYDLLEDLDPLFEDDCDEYFPSRLERRTSDPACAIRIGLDHNIPSILPTAFYHLCQVDFRSEYSMWEFGANKAWRFKREEDMRCLPKSYDFYLNRDEKMPLARWDLVDRDSLYRLELGRVTLQDISMTLASVFDADDSDSECEAEDVCTKERARLKKAHQPKLNHLRLLQSFRNPDPVGQLWKWWEEMQKDYERRNTGTELCISCQGAVRDAIRTKMNEIWEELPLVFHLNSLELS